MNTPQLRRILRKKFLILAILTLLLYGEFFLCTMAVKADSTTNTTILGYNIHTYFKPNPGVITPQPITAVVNIEGNFTGYLFVIQTVHFQILKGIKIWNEYYAYDDVHLSNLDHTWSKEIPLDIPEYDFAVRTFRCEFTVNVYWKQSEESSEQSQELNIEGDYTAKDNTGIRPQSMSVEVLLFLSILLFFFLIIVISFFLLTLFITKPDRYQAIFPFDTKNELLKIVGEWNTTLEPKIKQEFLEILPGEISLYQDYQKELTKKKKEIEYSIQMKENQLSEVLAKKQLIKENPLYGIFSSWFLKASRKRETYSQDVENEVQLLRKSLQQGIFDGFEKKSNCQLAYQMCAQFLKENEKELPIITYEEECSNLAGLVNKYNQNKTLSKTYDSTLPNQLNTKMIQLQGIETKITLINEHTNTFINQPSSWRSEFKKECKKWLDFFQIAQITSIDLSNLLEHLELSIRQFI